METIKLTHLNASLRVEGNENRRSLTVDQVLVTEPAQPDHSILLKLLVLDEKDMPVYSQALVPTGPHADKAVHIRQKFVFYDHLTLRVEAEPGGSSFAVLVTFS